MADADYVNLEAPEPSSLSENELDEFRRVYEFPAEVETVLPAVGEDAELVRPGFLCAYTILFSECALSFPLPPYLAEVANFLGLSLSQMHPNLIRLIVGIYTRAFEVGLNLLPQDFLRFADVKPNSSNPGTFYGSPRSRMKVLEGLKKDERWWTRYFFFKIDESSMGQAPAMRNMWTRALGRWKIARSKAYFS